MKKLVSLIVVGVKDEKGELNKTRFLQYHDELSGEEEYRIIEGEAHEKTVTKEQGNELYRKIIKNAVFRLKVV